MVMNTNTYTNETNTNITVTLIMTSTTSSFLLHILIHDICCQKEGGSSMNYKYKV
jgi:hypothetical protein